MHIFLGNGQFSNNPLSKLKEVITHVDKSEDKNASTSFTLNIKDACEKAGECLRKNGEKFVNKTVTVTKETIKKVPVKSIADTISKAKCVIPKNADNILRAALLQQCISPSHGE